MTNANARPRSAEGDATQEASLRGDAFERASGHPPVPEAEGRYRSEIVVGLAALSLVAALFLGVRYLQGRPFFGGSYPLWVRFEDAGGIVEGRAVTMSGIPVGTVGEVRLDPEARGVCVRLRIDEGVKVPEGSVASISGLAALDNVQVQVRRGPPRSPALEEGARLPAEETGTLATLRARAGPMAARLDTTLAGAAGTMRAANQLLNASRGDLRATFENLRAASRGTRALVAGEQERLGRTVENVETLTADLQVAAADVRRLTAENGDSLGVAVERMNRTLAAMERVSASAGRTASSLETVAARIEAGEGTLGRLLEDESLYVHTDSTMARLSRVLKGFEENPERYLRELKLVEVF